jgi:tRNA-(ms[2]io[6]A)-hydroxylase
MLNLAHRTPSAWAQAALGDIPALLADHRYCEGKAASSARAFVRRYGARYPKLARPLLALAQEEDAHFALVTRLLRKQSRHPTRHHGNPYISLLRRRVNRDGGGSELDQLVVAAFIEARSAERFRLLADALRGNPLGGVYEDLFASEARHHALFVRLAADVFGEAPASRRIEAVSAIEAEIVASRPWGSHLH